MTGSDNLRRCKILAHLPERRRAVSGQSRSLLVGVDMSGVGWPVEPCEEVGWCRSRRPGLVCSDSGGTEGAGAGFRSAETEEVVADSPLLLTRALSEGITGRCGRLRSHQGGEET